MSQHYHFSLLQGKDHLNDRYLIQVSLSKETPPILSTSLYQPLEVIEFFGELFDRLEEVKELQYDGVYGEEDFPVFDLYPVSDKLLTGKRLNPFSLEKTEIKIDINNVSYSDELLSKLKKFAWQQYFESNYSFELLNSHKNTESIHAPDLLEGL